MEPSNRRRRGGLLPLIALTIMAATALCTGALLGKRLSNTSTPRAASLRGGSVPSSPYVALCLTVANEHTDLPEWVEHHLGLGVGKIYVMDHASSPPLSTVLGEHIASGAVEYEWLPGVPPLPLLPGPAPERPWDFTYNNGSYFQLFAYDRCLELHRQKHTWMGFFDTDEFIILREDIPNLPALLRNYEQYGALALFPKDFGSSGHTTRPTGGVRESYLRCSPPEQPGWVKLLANTHYVLPSLGHAGPHQMLYRDNATAVNTKGVPVLSSASPHVVYDEAYHHHYFIKSREDYEAKIKRGSVMGQANRHNWNEFEKIDQRANLTCREALRYVQSAAPGAALHLRSQH